MKIDEIENFVLRNGDNNKQAIVDELATLRAQNAELREVLGALLRAVDLDYKYTGLSQRMQSGCVSSARAILAKYGDDNATS